MSFVFWTQDLNTDFPDVDEQHHILVDKINGLYDAYQTSDPEQVKTAFQELIDYTVYHFTQEEKMLEEAKYRMTEPHKKVHAHFVEKMTALQERFNNGDFSAVQEALDLCEGWLFRHIRLNDHGYVADVKAAGVR